MQYQGYSSVSITRKEDFDNPTVRMAALIFLLVGVVFLILGAVFFVFLSHQRESTVETEAVITDFDRDGYPYVTYTVDGQTYEVHLSYRSSTMRTGDTVSVRYDPENPRDAGASGVWLVFAAAFGGFGILFGGLGVVFLCMARKARQRKAEAGCCPDW